jgi:hypothetical protein
VPRLPHKISINLKGGNPTGQFLPDAPSRSENTMEAAGKIEGMVEEQWCAKCAQIK